MSASTFSCARCHRDRQLARPPIPGPLGEEIQSKSCVDCWAEWMKAEVMVINELRLDFMNPRSARILEQHMREFLHLDPADQG